MFFYGDRVLAIDTRGASGTDIIEQRYSLNSKSILVEHQEIRLSAKEPSDDEESIKPMEYRYELKQTTTSVNYGCVLRQKQGIAEKTEYTDELKSLHKSKLKIIPVEETSSESIKSSFISILSGVKAQRTENAKDALFRAANLPVIEIPEVEPEGDQD